MPRTGKRIRNAWEQVDKEKFYEPNDAISFLKDASKTKFDETVEIAMQLGVDPKHADQMVRGVIQMPSGTGKVTKVAVIAKADKHEEAKNAGADLVGAEDLLEKIKLGEIDVSSYNVYITTPDMMGIVSSSVARILGPKGLMPNPKLGTVTLNIKNAVTAAKSGQVEFRVEKAGIIHAIFGKMSFTLEQLQANLKALIDAVIKAKPTGAKGTYIKSLYMSSTMGPALKINISSIYEDKK